MRNNDNEAHANDHTDTKGKSDYPTHDWRNIVSSTLHGLFERSWAQNIIGGVALLLIAPLLGFLLMSNLRGMLIGAGIGLTILFWIMWGILIKNVAPTTLSGATPLPSATALDKELIPAMPTPEVTPTPAVAANLKTPEKTVSPNPTPVVPSSPSEISLTPTQIFDKMKAAITTRDRGSLATLCVRQSVDWTLSYFDATPNDEGITLYFVPDKQDSGIVACKVPTKGNERFPFNNPRGRQFRVRGTIEEVTLMYITLKDCAIDPISLESP